MTTNAPSGASKAPGKATKATKAPSRTSSAPSRASRAEQKEKRRNEILAVGLDLFIRKGFAATRIQDIAQAANISVGLMFHYFESKEKLYEELIRLGVSGPQSVMPSTDTDPITYFESVAKFLLDTIKNQPFTAKMFVLMNQALHNKALPPTVRELLPQLDIITPSIPLIKAGQKNMTIKDGDPYALSLAFWSAVNGIAEIIAVMPDAPCPEAAWVVDILRRKPE